ncbi:MAG: histidine--tRNA ligase [Firmicutes bacterium]|jgi:histidyl-tRNA synthetase|nr:histidine--tRNA ligase [Bacillota bacterium]
MLVKAPRGTADLLPGQIERWRWVEEVARDVFRQFGYAEIVTPIFEHTELFERGIGDTTDVVNKQMYTFLDRGQRSLTLRPEGTASVVRAYLEHHMYSGPQPVKLFYIGPIFRYERPQAGRYRQFHQLGAEALGSQDPALDVEMIAMSIEIFRRLGLADFLVHINSIGCEVCRPAYKDALRAYLQPKLDGLCRTCFERYEKNPLRILDCKVAACQDAAKGAPRSVDYLCESCREHFDAVQKYLDALGISYELNEMLVRGLDYYTKTVFEVESRSLGAQSALLGGGRYDGLVEECGGPSTPAVGFAAGMERAMLALEEQGIQAPSTRGVDAFVVAFANDKRGQVLALVHQLRQAGLVVETDYLQRSMKAQMKAASRMNAARVIICGEDELSRDVVQLRDMTSGVQEEVPLATLVERLRAELC